jgi:hypothetical protein
MIVQELIVTRENLAAALPAAALLRPMLFLRGAGFAASVAAGSRQPPFMAHVTVPGRPGCPKRPVLRPIAASVGVFHLFSFRRRASLGRCSRSLFLAVDARLAAPGRFTKLVARDSPSPGLISFREGNDPTPHIAGNDPGEAV